MARTCELWIKGTIENAGPKPYDALYLSNWAEDRAVLVATTTNGTGAAGSIVWFDQFGQRIGTSAAWHTKPITYIKNCVGGSFDCVNGGCVPQATYNTPGVFSTLAACQSGCAKNSNCTGECVDPAEIAAHQQAINNLKAKICG